MVTYSFSQRSQLLLKRDIQTSNERIYRLISQTIELFQLHAQGNLSELQSQLFVTDEAHGRIRRSQGSASIPATGVDDRHNKGRQELGQLRTSNRRFLNCHYRVLFTSSGSLGAHPVDARAPVPGTRDSGFRWNPINFLN